MWSCYSNYYRPHPKDDGRKMFSLCPPFPGGGGGTLSQVWMRGTRCGWGNTPSTPIQVPGQDGGTWGIPHHQDGVPPISRMGHPLSRSGQGGTPTGTAWCVLTTWRAVYLLHSHRRTFLCLLCYERYPTLLLSKFQFSLSWLCYSLMGFFLTNVLLFRMNVQLFMDLLLNLTKLN